MLQRCVSPAIKNSSVLGWIFESKVRSYLVASIMGWLLHMYFPKSPIFLAPGTSFVEDNFSMYWDWGGGREGRKSVQPRSLRCSVYSRAWAPMRI